VEVRRGQGAIEVESGKLRLRVDLDRLALDLESTTGRTRIRGARAAVDLGSSLAVAERAILDGYGDVRSRSGVATRIEVRARAEPSLELRLEIEAADDWSGIVLGLSVSNLGDSALPIRALLPLRVDADEGGDLRFPFETSALRFFRMGYQSWSPAGYVPLGAREPQPRLAFLKRMHQGPFTPRSNRGRHVSDFVTTLRAPTVPGITVGFTSHRRYLNHVVLEHRDGAPCTLAAVNSTEDITLHPRDTFRSERLWVGLDPVDSDGLAEWANRAGTEMEAPVPARVGTGWCSWYQFFTRVTAEDIERNVDALAPLHGQIETIQIDDGYQAAVGDWLEWDADFPDGVGPLAARIRSAGFRAGIWLAPFLVSRASRVAKEHPDWILRTWKGQPIVANVQPLWKGTVCYAVDPTHPEVHTWLGEVIGQLRRDGYDYLKLDFLYAGALTGARNTPRTPSAAAYRQAIQAIRDAAAPDPFLLGCGAPLGPSIGLFEAMRIGPDIAPKWRSRTEDAAAGLPAAPSARNAVRNVLSRAALHQRLWVNDPDCVLLRDKKTRLSETEVRTVAAAAAVSGGLLLLSDDLANLSDTRRDLLHRLLPPLGRVPYLGPTSGEIPDTLVQRFPDGSALVLVVNLGDGERPFQLDLPALGMPGTAHVYDVWDDRYVGVGRGSFYPGPIPAHGCALLRVTPADGRPRVVGSTLHVSGGAVEATRVQADGDGWAKVRLQAPGSRSGHVWVDPGSGEPVSTHVKFVDELTLSTSRLQIPKAAADPSEEGEGTT
jgi:alpha-galactosidase